MAVVALQAALMNQGIQHRRHRIRWLMKKHQLRPTWKRAFAHTNDSKHDLSMASLAVTSAYLSPVWGRPGNEKNVGDRARFRSNRRLNSKQAHATVDRRP